MKEKNCEEKRVNVCDRRKCGRERRERKRNVCEREGEHVRKEIKSRRKSKAEIEIKR